MLGVPRDADGHSIERAFHDLARDCHPDVADDHDADERFRELTEAYSVLASPETRGIYDSRGYRGRGDPAFEDALSPTPAWRSRGEETTSTSTSSCATSRHVMGRGVWSAIPSPSAAARAWVTEACTCRIRSRNSWIPACAAAARASSRQSNGCGSASLRAWRTRRSYACAAKAMMPAPARFRVISSFTSTSSRRRRIRGIIRYVALALLVLAVATLIVYLVR